MFCLGNIYENGFFFKRGSRKRGREFFFFLFASPLIELDVRKKKNSLPL